MSGSEDETPNLHPLDKSLAFAYENSDGLDLHYAYHSATFMRNSVRTNLSDEGFYYHRDDDALTNSTALKEDLYQSSFVVAKGLRRRFTAPWLVEDYCAMLTPNQDGRNQAVENEFSRHFPQLPDASEEPEVLPAIVTDEGGTVLMIYLPNCFSQRRMRDIDKAVGDLASKPDGPHTTNRKGWRGDPQLFKQGKNLRMHPGLLDLSPSWWPQGHGSSSAKPGPSSSLKDPEGDGRLLLQKLSPTLVLLGSILSVVQPGLFESGMAVMEELRSSPDLTKDPETVRDIIEAWMCPFAALSLIINRRTPLHRDTQGLIMGFDLLVTGGNYTNGVFRTPGLGKSWRYNPGTVIGLMGKVIAHEVEEVNGERYCLATYWRQRLFSAAKVEVPLPSTIDELLYAKEPKDWTKDTEYSRQVSYATMKDAYSTTT